MVRTETASWARATAAAVLGGGGAGAGPPARPPRQAVLSTLHRTPSLSHFCLPLGCWLSVSLTRSLSTASPCVSPSLPPSLWERRRCTPLAQLPAPAAARAKWPASRPTAAAPPSAPGATSPAATSASPDCRAQTARLFEACCGPEATRQTSRAKQKKTQGTTHQNTPTDTDQHR
jgi:hypothetical protein